MVSSYKEKYNSETGFYEIISDAIHTCPYDGGELKYRDKVIRKCRDLTGTMRCYLLQRLVCVLCGALHREIPDIIVPYKHYDSPTIQCVLDGDEDSLNCEADDSTIRRWKRDFEESEADISQRLASVYAESNDGKAPILSAEDIITRIKSGIERWLPYVMELLINNGHKLCTRFAFCPPGTCVKVASGSNNYAEGGGKHEQTIKDTG